MKNLRIYERDPSLKQSQRDSEELKENGETASGDAARTFPPLIQQLVMILPSFPRLFRLIH